MSIRTSTTPERLLKQKRDEILAIAAKRGATNVRIFGSLARGENNELSDVDFLVDLQPGRTLLDLGGLLMDLQKLLDCNVDVATPDLLRQHIRHQILSEAVPL